MYKLISILLLSLSSCTIVHTHSIPQQEIKELKQPLLIDAIVDDYLSLIPLVKTQDDFNYLTNYYYNIVFYRLKFNDMEKSYFISIVEEKSEELNYSFEYD